MKQKSDELQALEAKAKEVETEINAFKQEIEQIQITIYRTLGTHKKRIYLAKMKGFAQPFNAKVPALEKQGFLDDNYTGHNNNFVQQALIKPKAA